MRSTLIIGVTVLFSASALAQSWPEPPPTTAASNTISDCTYWNVVASGQTCDSIASDNNLSLAQFRVYNPVVGTGSTCPLVLGNSYCVERNYGLPTETTTTTPPELTTTTTSRPSTTTGNGVQTPQPFQPGMVSNCNKFHFVTSGQGCPQVASLNGITTAQVIQYNPEVGSDCRFSTYPSEVFAFTASQQPSKN